MHDIFISYSRDGQTGARTLAEALGAAGGPVWRGQHLRTSEPYGDIIEHKLDEARCVIVLWSQKPTRSQYVKNEAADNFLPSYYEYIVPFKR